MAKDVIEVLGRAAGYILCSAGSEHEDYRAMHDAIDRIADLIAADVEYNEAKATLFGWNTSFGSRYRRYLVAEERRAAALAACRGLA
jgi:hypothetical protein